MTEQENDKIYVDETKLNQLMRDLGFEWDDIGNIWWHSSDVKPVEQNQAIEALRTYLTKDSNHVS